MFGFLKYLDPRNIVSSVNEYLNPSDDDSKRVDLKFGAEMNFASLEAYNLLRTNLYFSLPIQEGRGNVIGVTSSVPQEGKSYTTINLAYTLAKDGKKVLLIDADMRKPSIAGKLNVENEKGLSNLLSQNADANLYVDGLQENMKVLLSGPMPPNPSELLGGNRIGSLIEKWRGEFDYVIIDLPPVNIVTDALILSRYIDGFIISVRHNYSRKKEVSECVRQLRFANAHIIGCVYRGFSHGNHYYRKKYETKSADAAKSSTEPKSQNKTDKVADLHARLGKIDQADKTDEVSSSDKK